MIKIDFKQYIRDRKWGSFKYIVYENRLQRPDAANCESEWGFFSNNGISLARKYIANENLKFWLLRQLNRWA